MISNDCFMEMCWNLKVGDKFIYKEKGDHTFIGECVEKGQWGATILWHGTAGTSRNTVLFDKWSIDTQRTVEIEILDKLHRPDEIFLNILRRKTCLM